MSVEVGGCKRMAAEDEQSRTGSERLMNERQVAELRQTQAMVEGLEW